MKNTQLKSNWQLHIACITTSTILSSAPVLAQLIPDKTLGTENSTVNQINPTTQRIDGGAIRASNLFHSFQEFNVAPGKGVYFSNPVGIENILTRVTGGNPSNIFGKLGVFGDSNLYLINPNGIMFGANASLDIKGSFLATTAPGIKLGENGFFSAVNPNQSQLLSVNPQVVFANNLSNPQAEIVNRGNLEVGKDLTLQGTNLDLQGQLLAKGNLTLQAVDTVKMTDSINNPFIAASWGDLLVQGNKGVEISALNHPESGLFAGRDLVLRSDETVVGDAHFWSGGSFQVQKLDGSLGGLHSPKDPVIRTTGDVFIGAYQGGSLHIIAGGKVEIPGYILITGADPQFGLGETITLSSGQQINIDGKNKPTVDIRAGVSPDSIGTPFFQGNGIFLNPTSFPVTPTSADITVGTILFNADPFNLSQKIAGDVLLTNQYRPNPLLQGNITAYYSQAGFIAIETGSVDSGGRVIIDSRDQITIRGIVDSSASGKIGKGGDVLIYSAGDTSLLGAQIKVASGQGGNINVKAKNLNVSGSLLQAGIGQGQGFEGGEAGEIKLDIAENTVIDTSLIANGILPFGTAKKSGATIINTGNLSLINGAKVNSNTTGKGEAGAIQITARGSITMTGNSPLLGSSAISAQVQKTGEGKGGDITINTSNLTLEKGANIDASTLGLGDSGSIKIIASGDINVIGQSSLPQENFAQSGITSQVQSTGKGNSGGIIINASNLTLKDGGRIDASTLASTTTPGKGNAGAVDVTVEDSILITGESSTGNISEISSQVKTGTEGSGNSDGIVVNTSNLTLENGGAIQTNTLGKGNAGSIQVTATDNITIAGEARINKRFVSRISSQVNEDGEQKGIGNSGKISIDTSTLNIEGGGSISANTFSLGSAGEIRISATDNLTISGESSDGFGSNISSQVRQKAEGNSGGIVIYTSILTLENGGFIDATTDAIGSSGKVQIEAENITLKGKTSRGIGSAIGSQAEVTAEGSSQGIEINTTNLSLQDGAFISASSANTSDAGNILIESLGTVSLNDSDIRTTSDRSSGGAININAANIRLRGDSDIRTNVANGAGGGGNITVNADSIIAFDDSDILAFAQDGKGGDITFNTPVFFGDSFRPAPDGTPPLTLDNNGFVDVNASGAVSGNIALPNLDFVRNSLTDLPENVVDTDSIIANSCVVPNAQETGSFVITGSGGLPLRPGDATVSEYPTGKVRAIPEGNSSNTQVVEPQGVYRLPNGNLVLSRRCE
ncbi:two-partner secretion domain-containing protein [Merismopedia glauca]|uniref:Filamentous haemagglutinin FhaB/tRNA nuclease CdiA-like TPS domain-containing protein n=1 Tax=Merismopedia glauca CCAP 1448/3 TaxID=1296344 RepID=A0A2T1C0Y8_9CYAN|nr:filamentous hemagglutinin N-terminal domain-containing protein [Merismopedia glauca]PSB01864.1 hypothetical protein C7B64_16160 [Merismopedia glauca CCAP 1448/3]